MRSAIVVGMAAATAACGSSAPAQPDAAPPVVDAGPTLYTPLVPDHGGPIVAQAQVVTVTWTGDTLAPDLEAFDAWLPQSEFWTSTLGQYRVQAGAQTATVHVTDSIGATLDDSALKAELAADIASGELPPATASTIYTVYTPAGTTVTQTYGSNVYASCDVFSGYHSTGTLASGALFYYAVVPRCPSENSLSETDTMTWFMSHELAEVATDPVEANHAWIALPEDALDQRFTPYGGELADLCEGYPLSVEGHEVTALYSNAAAAALQRPCVPAAAGAMIFAAGDPFQLVLTAGHSVTSTVTVESSDPTLTGMTFGAYALDPMLTITPAVKTVNAGDHVTVTATLAAGAPDLDREIVLNLATTDYMTITYLLADP